MKKPVLVATVRHDSAKRGWIDLDLSFLIPWLGRRTAEAFAEALVTRGAGQASGSSVYAIRGVLKVWSQLSPAGARFLAAPQKRAVIIEEMTEPRHAVYETSYARTGRVSTANNKWNAFLGYLRTLTALKVIPKADYVGLVPALPASLVSVTAEQARQGYGDPVLYPSTMCHEEDAFHTGILVPISLTKDDREYIESYAHQLGSAIGLLKNAAQREIEELAAQWREGQRLAKAADYPRIRATFQAARERGPGRYIDPKCRLHFFDSHGGHPELLSNLLALVNAEMDGIPKARTNERKVDGRRTRNVNRDGGGHWLFVSRFGKNKLLPYLGMLTSRTMAPFVVLLLLEHPHLNVSSLLRAKLTSKNGSHTLLYPLEEPGRSGISVEKPRAKRYKQAALNSVTQHAVELLIEMTAKARGALKKAGRLEESEYLWVGMHMIDYRIMRLSEKQLTSAIRVDERFTSKGEEERATRLVTFMDSHEELAPWRTTITLKALRVSAGLMEYFDSGGDLVAAARAWGHVDVQTTINHYVPRSLQIALHEHRIRRHQNLLLILSAMGADEMLAFTDFRSVEELHQFLESHVTRGREWINAPKTDQPVNVTRRAILSSDPYALSVAMLYRDHVKSWPQRSLEQPDAKTGIRPSAWVALVAALDEPLPDSMAAFNELVERARRDKDNLKPLVRFPRAA